MMINPYSSEKTLRVEMHSPPKVSHMNKYSSDQLTTIWITLIIVGGLVTSLLGGLYIGMHK